MNLTETLFTRLVLLLALVSAVNVFALAQQVTISSSKDTAKTATATDAKADEQATEKAVATSPKVSISLCVSAGDVVVRGWQREEVRVLAEGGNVSFKIKERNEENKPVWLFVQNQTAANSSSYDECLSGDNFEIEVPYGASVSIKSPDAAGGNLLIESVAKAAVQNVSGNVHLRNVTQEIQASSLSGNVSAEDSSGKIALKSFDGNIAAFRLRPNEFSDALNLNSASGNVVMRAVAHKNIEAKSASGDIAVFESLVRGGNYEFNTVNGSIILQLPVDFPFQIKAMMAKGGNFQTDFPVKTNLQTLAGQSRLMTATNGAGETTINLTTFNGFLQLKKK